MKNKKQPKKKKTFKERLAKLFLILAILFLLLAVSGVSVGVISIFAFCLLCGLACLYVSRLLKKSGKNNEQIASTCAPEPVTAMPKTKVEDRAAAVAELKECVNNFNMVDITFPDGHVEKRHTLSTIDADEGCLITDGGYTYHTDCGCFCNWSEKYQERFTGWQLISISEARRRGLRKCKFCVENDEW